MNPLPLCIYEDAAVRGFYPLTELRHVADLLVGQMTLYERARILYGDRPIALIGRHEIEAYLSEEASNPPLDDDGVLLLNGRVLPNAAVRGQLPDGKGWIARDGVEVVAAGISADDLSSIRDENGCLDPNRLIGYRNVDLHGVSIYRRLWDLLDDNNARIAEDFASLHDALDPPTFNPPPGVHAVYPEAILCMEGVTIKPGVVLDASDGPIILSNGVTILPNSVLIGPCVIGTNSTIKAGAKIYGGTTIGQWCKVGGEVENSIFIGYGNKQHDGFVGHSYFGAWVNLGADTNTSDLKNTYGTIRVTLPEGEFDSGRRFLGTMMGDHSKTGINTMLNTGTIVGIFANVFGAGFPPKLIPPFSWGGGEDPEAFALEKALEIAATVMGRRNVELTDADRVLLSDLHGRYTSR